METIYRVVGRSEREREFHAGGSSDEMSKCGYRVRADFGVYIVLGGRQTGEGEKGRRGDGAMGRWGDGTMGRVVKI